MTVHTNKIGFKKEIGTLMSCQMIKWWVFLFKYCTIGYFLVLYNKTIHCFLVILVPKVGGKFAF